MRHWLYNLHRAGWLGPIAARPRDGPDSEGGGGRTQGREREALLQKGDVRTGETSCVHDQASLFNPGHSQISLLPSLYICKPFEEPRNRFRAWAP
jgi:hypothetical protein